MFSCLGLQAIADITFDTLGSPSLGHVSRHGAVIGPGNFGPFEMLVFGKI
jgi:hypothetical protein